MIVIHMSNDLFKALSSKTRIEMLKTLEKKEMHISGLARELNLSTPVVARHVKILEREGLIERTNFGNTHILRSNTKNIHQVFDLLSDSYEIELPKGASMLDALKKVSGVEVRKVDDKEFVVSIDGEEGFYVYEVDGIRPDATVDKVRIEKDSVISWEKLISVPVKKISVKIK